MSDHAKETRSETSKEERKTSEKKRTSEDTKVTIARDTDDVEGYFKRTNPVAHYLSNKDNKSE